MTRRLTNQPERLSYTRRDLELIDAEVDAFISYFIPRIKNVGKANVGRLFIRILEALVDKLNYSLDMRFRQSVLRTVSELQSAIDITELVRYKPVGASSATADLTLTTLSGPAPAGGIAVPQYSAFLTDLAPVQQFIALEATSIPEGASSLEGVSVVQGTRVVNQTILASAVGEPSEEVRFPVAITPHDYIEIKVDGTDYEIVDDFRDSEATDRHVVLTTDEDLYTTATFGDGTYGAKLAAGSVVTATYLQSNGEDSVVPAGSISRVSGSLSALISATNPEASSGGYNGDEVEDIARKAPLQASTFWRANRSEDFETLATTLVPGVYKALASTGDGALVDLYIMPEGGGVASSALLALVEDTLAPRILHGATLNAHALTPAHVLIKMDVALLSRKVNKSLARKRLFEAISAFKLNGQINPDGALYYRNLRIGRGFALSDVSSLVEQVDDGTLVDFVDFVKFTRYPTPIAGTGVTVEFNGEVVPSSLADYDDWSVQAVTTTTYYVYKNGVYDSEGTVAVEHTTADGSLTFTLGESGDTFNVGDQWAFSSSSYRNNIKLGSYEFMELVRDSDLDITVYFPGELEIGS